MPTDELYPFDEHRSCLTMTRLSEDTLPQDSSLGRVRKLRKHIDIWQPTDAADRIYFLQRGKVEIYSGDPQARDILLQTVTAGEPFGELCFCAETGSVRNTIARTLQPVTLVEIDYVAFLKYVRAADQVLSALIFTMCQRVSDCETRTEMLAQRGAQERVGLLLLQLAAKVSKAAGRAQRTVQVRKTHGELASLAAMSRAHVTVTLGLFRRGRLIQYERGQALTVNVPALTAYLARRQA